MTLTTPQLETGATNNSISINTKKPMLQFVKKITQNKRKNSGGSKEWSCNLCVHTFKGSYTRVYHHLLAIPGDGVKASTCPLEKRTEITKLHMVTTGGIVELEEEISTIFKKPRISSFEKEQSLTKIQLIHSGVLVNLV